MNQLIINLQQRQPFMDIVESKHHRGRVAWIILFLICIGYLTYNVVLLIDEFAEFNAVSEITIKVGMVLNIYRPQRCQGMFALAVYTPLIRSTGEHYSSYWKAYLFHQRLHIF